MDLGQIEQAATKDILGAKDSKELDGVRVRYVGRKGRLTLLLRSLKELPEGERRKVGVKANALKKELESLIEKRRAAVASNQERITSKLDVTKPGKKVRKGSLHPITQVDMQVREIFTSMNFSVVEGPEVETEYYNFDALNVPADHPARDVWDTFWLRAQISRGSGGKSRSGRGSAEDQRLLLRTHTSPMQVRYMEKHDPPVRVIVPGRCFRYEATDASHETNFHQVEGLMVGGDITLGNFKFVVEEFLRKLFAGQKIDFRFRPSYFPFTEPSVEVDMKLRGKWLEIMGAGMVNPRVFKYVGYDPKMVQGFAFGFGLERVAMVKYNIPDVRMFYSGDLRFTRQFG